MVVPPRAPLASLLVLVLLGASTEASPAQFVEPYDPDPAASEALGRVMKAYRDRPAHVVKSRILIELVQGETRSRSEEIVAEFTYDRRGAGVVKIKDFACHFDEGTLAAVHTGRAVAYARRAFDARRTDGQ